MLKVLFWHLQGRRLLVLGTTSAAGVMDDMGVAATFNVALHVPSLREEGIHAVLTHLAVFHPSDVRSLPWRDRLPCDVCCMCHRCTALASALCSNAPERH